MNLAECPGTWYSAWICHGDTPDGAKLVFVCVCGVVNVGSGWRRLLWRGQLAGTAAPRTSGVHISQRTHIFSHTTLLSFSHKMPLLMKIREIDYIDIHYTRVNADKLPVTTAPLLLFLHNHGMLSPDEYRWTLGRSELQTTSALQTTHPSSIGLIPVQTMNSPQLVCRIVAGSLGPGAPGIRLGCWDAKRYSFSRIGRHVSIDCQTGPKPTNSISRSNHIGGNTGRAVNTATLPCGIANDKDRSPGRLSAGEQAGEQLL